MTYERVVGLEDGVRTAFLVAGILALFAVPQLIRGVVGRPPAPRRRRKASVARMALVQTIVVVTLWTYHDAGAWTGDSIGVSRRVSPVVAFAVGVFEFYLFTTAMSAILRMVGAPPAYWRAMVRANATFVPRDRTRQLAAAILVVIVNPFTEELFFRGLLVHQFVFIGASLWVALAVGALVNAVNHAYQGLVLAPHHLLFYACAVALLFSPLGIMGAIGFHFGGDALPIFGYRRQLQAYRALKRARRAKPGSREPRPGA